MESAAVPPAPRSAKHRTLLVLALAELLAMSLWFSASAVAPQLAATWDLGPSGQAWLTMSVQIGFVIGALGSAATNLADRVPARVLVAGSALLGAGLNALIPLLADGAAAVFALRLLTGVTLAGVYPPGMKLVASWTRADRGLYIGLLVGALAVGSASPHLLGALTLGEGVAWRPVLYGASVLALAGAALVAAFVRPGPELAAAARFHPRHALAGLRERPVRLANFGYFGHMWELYAVWTWLPLLLLESYAAAELPLGAARAMAFATIAAGGVGSLLAGRLADRWGRTRTTALSLAASGACALVAGALAPWPFVLTAVALLWGFVVVADSAQFSAAVSELADPRYVGTALTVQTSLGFLLTLVTIRLVPTVVTAVGWWPAFALLALGPALGLAFMLRLRRLPEAERMASGNR